MKHLLIFIFLLILSFSLSAKPRTDTTDNWTVYYNKNVIARCNEVDNPTTIKIDCKKIKAGDTLTIKYFCDAPNQKSKTGVYIFDNDRQRIILSSGKGTFSPLKIALKDILEKRKSTHRDGLDFYYFDELRNRLLFKLKLEL
jgi:hypothetical protein